MPELLHALGINWGVFIAQIVNFTILLLVLAKFVYRPVMKLLDGRREKIRETLLNERRAAEKLLGIAQEREAALALVRTESERIIEEAKKSGAAVSKKMLEEAKEAIARLRADEERRLAGERAKLVREVRREIGEVVVGAIEQSMGDVLDVRAQGRMVKQALAVLREEQRANPIRQTAGEIRNPGQVSNLK